MTHTIQQGASEPADFLITNDGEAIDGTGQDLALVITTDRGAAVDTKVTVWAASTAYVKGDVVRPATATGQFYKCTTVAGTSDLAEPTFPTSTGATVVDNTVTWQETTPTAVWSDAPTGLVRVTGLEALPVGEYAVRYKLTDGAGTFGYAPNGDDADVWDVVPVLP